MTEEASRPTTLPFAGRPLVRAGLIVGLLVAGYLAGRFLPRPVLHVIYAAVLALIAYHDLRRRRVPNVISYQALLFALGAMWASPTGPGAALLGGAVAAVALLIPVAVYGVNRAGIGDVKLAAFIGLILSWSPALFWAAFIAFVSAAMVSLAGILLGKLTFKSSVPFGPFMALGACIALLIRF
jgi:leader peptidase (prepilin peptidase)/N-methyltransferase